MSEQQTTQQTIIGWLKIIGIALFVICLGLFAVNQVLEFRYSNEFLQTPCQLCFQLNPDVKTVWDARLPTEVGQKPNYTIEFDWSKVK